MRIHILFSQPAITVRCLAAETAAGNALTGNARDQAKHEDTLGDGIRTECITRTLVHPEACRQAVRLGRFTGYR